MSDSSCEGFTAGELMQIVRRQTREGDRRDQLGLTIAARVLGIESVLYSEMVDCEKHDAIEELVMALKRDLDAP